MTTSAPCLCIHPFEFRSLHLDMASIRQLLLLLLLLPLACYIDGVPMLAGWLADSLARWLTALLYSIIIVVLWQIDSLSAAGGAVQPFHCIQFCCCRSVLFYCCCCCRAGLWPCSVCCGSRRPCEWVGRSKGLASPLRARSFRFAAATAATVWLFDSVHFVVKRCADFVAPAGYFTQPPGHPAARR